MARKRKLRAPVKIAPVKIAPKPIKPDPSPLEKEPSSEKEFGANDDADQKLSPTIDDKQQLAVVAPEDVPSQTEPDSKEQPETDLIDDENLRSKRVRQWMIEQQQQKERSDSRAESGESETIENPADDPLEEHGYPMTDEASQLTAASEIPLRHRLKAYTEKEILNSVMYECEWFKCGFETTEDMEYMTHVESHLADYLREQRDSRSIPCLWDLCDFKAGTSSDLESHLHFHAYHNRMKTHGASLSNIIQIPKCNSDSRRRNCIDMYRITFQCEWEDCEEYYNKAQLFFNHTNNHVQDQFPVDKRSRKEPVQCQWAFCKQTYKRASIGLEHIRRHSTERTIGCYTCGAMFVSRLKYIDHCKRQVEYHNREYPCSQCNKLFATKQLMVDHKNIHNKKFACSLCPMMWPSRKALAYHIRYRHVEEKPFKCLVCSHRCVTRSDLDEHVLTHDDRRMFRCEEFGCEAAYKCQKSLKKHVDSVHYGIGAVTYACHQCPSQYKSGAYLSKHLVKTHHYKRPPGYNRFTYRADRDGIFRLSTVVNSKLSGATDDNGEASQSNRSVYSTKKVKLEPGIDKNTSFDIGKMEAVGRTAISIELKVRDIAPAPSKPNRSASRTSVADAQSALPVLTKIEPCPSSSAETVTGAKNVDDFTVMKRYIKEEKTVVISFQETDSAGSVIRSETVQTTELTPDGILSSEL
ncbi:histone H4 transcription factor isoform X2 [Wyeomyia smithii]|uniref:histone H4 transcription factor isoform X2 n=1 Tax=Wyeomyia smithii TaxID=174621 RepID=UPI002467D7B4|nr:histone H4 transcription factor isoform X2 [Wyeomyia smithii]